MSIRKSILVFAVAAFASLALFAENYTVKSVTGKVQYQDGGAMKAVSVGQVLPDSATVSTSLNSSLVLTRADNSTVTIKAMKKNTIAKLVAEGAGGGTLKKGSGVTKSNVAGASKGGDKGVATASSRASEAKEDVEWDEE